MTTILQHYMNALVAQNHYLAHADLLFNYSGKEQNSEKTSKRTNKTDQFYIQISNVFSILLGSYSRQSKAADKLSQKLKS